MNDTWIKLFRKFREWEWYRDNNTKSLFIEILLSANFEDKKWQGVLIKRGQLITSVQNLLEALNKNPKKPDISTQNIRTSLNKLKLTNEITIETTSKYTVITVNKFNEYQQVTKELTNDQQTANKRLTTTKEYKERKEYKDINTYISHFNEKFGSNYQPTKGRETKLKLRLKSFSIEQILTAVDNLYQSPFHRGQNDKGWRADVDFLIRNDEQVDKWLNVNPRASNGVILKSLDDVQVEDIKNNPEKLIIYKKQKYDVSRFVRQD